MISHVNHSKLKEGLSPGNNRRWNADRNLPGHKWTDRNHNPANAVSKEEAMTEAEDKEKPVVEIMVVEEEEDFK